MDCSDVSSFMSIDDQALWFNELNSYNIGSIIVL